MKTYLAHVYQPQGEEIPSELGDFMKSLNQNSTTVEEADVHVVFIGRGSDLTPEFEWIKENATNVVTLVLSNKFRRFAPKDFTWQECISLKRRKDVENLVSRLNAVEWSGPKSLEECAKEREEKRVTREQRKSERAKNRGYKKTTKSLAQVLDLLRQNQVSVDVPEGAKSLSLRLIVDWQ